MLTRALRHLLAPPWLVRKAFAAPALERIEDAITASEQRHSGEIRFVVEGALEFLEVVRGLSARQRALDVFSLLRVWDTEENSGVLIYVQLVERDIEIVADRGIASRVSQPEWDAICHRMEEGFKAQRYEESALGAIAAVSEILDRHFPAQGRNPDELPDTPVIL